MNESKVSKYIQRFSCCAGGLIVSRCQNEKREKGGGREGKGGRGGRGGGREKNIQLMRQITTIL